MLVNLDLSDSSEALMLANRMAASGYFFPIDDHVLQVKNDNTYYRFQVRFQDGSFMFSIFFTSKHIWFEAMEKYQAPIIINLE